MDSVSVPVEGEHKRRSFHRFTFKVTRAAACTVAVLSLASFLGRLPVFELATHFRLQYALCSSVCVLFFIRPVAWKFLLLALCCAAINWSYVLPYYLEAKPHALETGAGQSTRLVVMFANVEGSNKNYAALLASVKEAQPDVVALAEVTDAWWEEIQSLKQEYPDVEAIPKQGGSGLALFSRYPLEDAQVFNVDASTHPLIFARVRLPNTSVSLLLMHPPTPVRLDKFAYRTGQFNSAAELLRDARGHEILIGDLNITPWSPYFQELLSATGLREARAGVGVLPTWPMPMPAFLRIPIDHCLVSRDIQVVSLRIGDKTGSDHLPLVMEIRLPNDGK